MSEANEMPTFAGVLESSKDGPAFSNADEGYAWMADWCGRPQAPCRHDDQFGGAPEGATCPLLDVAILHPRTPAEWGERRRGVLGGEAYTCSKYEPAEGQQAV